MRDDWVGSVRVQDVLGSGDWYDGIGYGSHSIIAHKLVTGNIGFRFP